MTVRVGVARSIANGGRGVAWLFLFPAIIVLAIAVDTSVEWDWPGGRSQEVDANIATAVICLLLWYFVIGRIPNRASVRNVRRQVADEVVVFGADILTAPHRSARFLARFNGAVPNVFVASDTGIQFWTGKGDSARPVATWRWEAVGAIELVDEGVSPFIAVTTSGNSVPYILTLCENRTFSTLRIRGKARARVGGQLEGLREDAIRTQGRIRQPGL